MPTFSSARRLSGLGCWLARGAAGRPGLEPALADAVEHCFGQNAAGRIVGTEEQDVDGDVDGFVWHGRPSEWDERERKVL